MEDRKEEKAVVWMSVPAFGEWEQHRGGEVPDYSVDFSKIRENRRRNKSHVSIGADEDLFSSSNSNSNSNAKEEEEEADRVVRHINRSILRRPARSRSPTRMKKIMSYLNCCGALGS